MSALATHAQFVHTPRANIKEKGERSDHVCDRKGEACIELSNDMILLANESRKHTKLTNMKESLNKTMEEQIAVSRALQSKIDFFLGIIRAETRIGPTMKKSDTPTMSIMSLMKTQIP